MPHFVWRSLCDFSGVFDIYYSLDFVGVNVGLLMNKAKDVILGTDKADIGSQKTVNSVLRLFEDSLGLCLHLFFVILFFVRHCTSHSTKASRGCVNVAQQDPHRFVFTRQISLHHQCAGTAYSH